MDPNYACAYYTRGRVNAALGQYDDAITDFTTFINFNPPRSKVSDTLIRRGAAYRSKGDTESAIDDYSQALALTPDQPIALYNRGSSYLALGKYNAAREDLDRAATLFQVQGQTDNYNTTKKMLDSIPSGETKGTSPDGA